MVAVLRSVLRGEEMVLILLEWQVIGSWLLVE